MKKRSMVTLYSVLGLIILVVFGLIMTHQLKRGDFPAHIAWAREYGTNGYLYKIPHTLFAKSVVIVRALLPANFLVWVSPFAKQVFDLKSYEISAWIVMILSYLATAFILLKRFMKNWVDKKHPHIGWIAGLAVFVTLLVGPLFLFTFPNRMYLGYISPNPYHNPTYILFRPFVLLIFFGIVDNLFKKWNWREAIIMVVAILCASLAKPSFTITILPALGALLLLFYLKRFKEYNWFFLIGPVAITGILVLLAQYTINYFGARGDQIMVSPFLAILTVVPNIGSSIFFIVMSILFPLLVTVLYFKKIKDNLAFQLVWINFIVSACYGLLLAEKFNLGSLNFWWSLMIAVFLLFVETISFWGKELLNKGFPVKVLTWKEIVLGSTLFIHLTCGVIYFITVITSTATLVV